MKNMADRQAAKPQVLLSAGAGAFLLAALAVSAMPAADAPRVAVSGGSAPLSFSEMQRPDPVALLTPAALPGRVSPSR